MTFRLRYAAISDVGRVRKDNQDSGYVGPWMLAVCDGVGGAARGDLASATAIGQLRKLDARPNSSASDDMNSQVAGALHRANDRIAELVDDDPTLSGTSTTATMALFDGEKLTFGHVGDSRAYLFRDGEIRQVTKDHTFVQSLIDEGRITEEESRTHPHRNLILKAIDGVHDIDADLFDLEVQHGDRLLFCSDGASGVLDDGRLADVLSMGTPDYAAVELVRASLEAGTTDNVTCVVADIVEEDELPGDQQPMLVGAAADLKRRSHLPTMPHLFRGHRAGDTGELEPVRAEIPDVPFAIETDPVDPEAVRYAPRPPRRFLLARRVLAGVAVVGVAWILGAAAYSWSQQQFYVGDHEGTVTIFRGVDADLPGVSLSQPYETTNVTLARLSDYDASTVRQGIDADSLGDAQDAVRRLAANQSIDDVVDEATAPSDTATPSESATPTGTPTDTVSATP
jgi:serine/threonine protein phosphatase PrpC